MLKSTITTKYPGKLETKATHNNSKIIFKAVEGRHIEKVMSLNHTESIMRARSWKKTRKTIKIWNCISLISFVCCCCYWLISFIGKIYLLTRCMLNCILLSLMISFFTFFHSIHFSNKIINKCYKHTYTAHSIFHSKCSSSLNWIFAH